MGVILMLILAALGVGTEFLMRGLRNDGKNSDSRTAVRAEASAQRAQPAAAGRPEPAAPCSIVSSRVPLPRDVTEASGAAWSRSTRGLIWTHNDSGEPWVVAVDETGAERARVRVTGATVTDWEDVASAPCAGGNCLYVADIGDNQAERRNITIYRVPEPQPTATATARAEALNATYPDGPQDAEAIFVLPDGGVYVVTKGETGPASLYRFPQPLRPGATVALEKVAGISTAQLDRPDRITGASASPDGRWLALRTLRALSLYRTDGGAVRGLTDPLRMDLRDVDEKQGEGVALADSGTVFLTSESGGKKNDNATLARLACTLPG
ncbi:MAG TPA: hypothetical protein VFS20_10490 [Longimicrobium sp.]|nr:hypothetical protein [Longimicrobium sp.]